jgi:hypothetical protein
MDQLVQILAAIGSMADLCDKLPDDPALLDQPTSDLKHSLVRCLNRRSTPG